MIVRDHPWEERPDAYFEISQTPRKLNSGDEDEKAICATGTLGDNTHGSREDRI
jgi:hypothetical protein